MGFDVSMDDVVPMTVANGLQDLTHVMAVKGKGKAVKKVAL